MVLRSTSRFAALLTSAIFCASLLLPGTAQAFSIYSTSVLGSNPPSKNCIVVNVMTSDAHGNIQSGAHAGVLVTLDGKKSALTNQFGYVAFSSVSAGMHQVTEDVPEGWGQQSVQPAGGNVYVARDSTCSNVRMINDQMVYASRGLTLSVQSVPATVRPGQSAMYRMTVTNDDYRSQRFDVQASLDAGMQFVSASDAGQLIGDGSVVWSDISIAGHSTKIVTLRASVSAVDMLASPVHLTVRIGDITQIAFTNIGGGATATEPLQDQSLVLTVEAETYQVASGDRETFTGTIHNMTDATIGGVALKEVHDSEQFNAFLASDGGTVQPGTVDWDVGLLAPYAARTFTVRGQIADVSQGTLRSTFMVTDPQGMQTRSTSVTTVATLLPQTGVADFLSPIEDAPQNLSPVLSEGDSFFSIIIGFFGFVASAGALVAYRRMR